MDSRLFVKRLLQTRKRRVRREERSKDGFSRAVACAKDFHERSTYKQWRDDCWVEQVGESMLPKGSISMTRLLWNHKIEQDNVKKEREWNQFQRKGTKIFIFFL